jgi:hypothetical protein
VNLGERYEREEEGLRRGEEMGSSLTCGRGYIVVYLFLPLSSFFLGEEMELQLKLGLVFFFWFLVLVVRRET